MFASRLLIRFLVSFLFLLFFFKPVKAQEPAKLISALNTAGSSNTVTIDSRKYFYQQSIGQPGITGLSAGNNKMSRQGFIQPLAGRKSSASKNDLQTDFYPNPFSDHITLTFRESLTEEVIVSLYDLNGRIVYLKKFAPAIEMNLDFSGLPYSVYVMKINTSGRSFYAKVIKLSH